MVDRVSGILVLTPAESKRLLGKAVATMPEVLRALERGRVIIANGTTTAYVAEEILGRPVDKYWYAAGYVAPEGLTSTPAKRRLVPISLVNGQLVDRPWPEVLDQFKGGDVFVKSANAVDSAGNVGILMSNPRGGTIGQALGIVTARGCHLVVPVGLEKMVTSVPQAARVCGLHRLSYSMGSKAGLMPVSNATVVTEIEALQLLARVEATHVASGGIGGAEGTVTLVIEGTDQQVRQSFALVESLKGEAPVSASN